MNIVNIGYDSTNYWLLAHAQPILLVDAGWPGTLPKFQHAAQRAGVDLANIPYVLVTHYHPDHAGLVTDLVGGGTRLIVIEEQVAAIPLMSRYIKPEQRFREISLQGAIRLRAADSRAFLQKIAIAGEIVNTPGHSDDSVTLILDEGAAFTGDLTPLFAATDEAAAILERSWAQLRERGVSTVYPGHGPAQPLR